MSELTFLVEHDPSGGYAARSQGESIFTEGGTRDELIANVREAVEVHFDDPTKAPAVVRLNFANGEVLTVSVESPRRHSPEDIQQSQQIRYALRGSAYRYDDPFEPACPPEDWDALK